MLFPTVWKLLFDTMVKTTVGDLFSARKRAPREKGLICKRLESANSSFDGKMLLLIPERTTMGRKSKWIDIESPSEHAPEVARRAIRARLAMVWEWLPLAANQSNDGGDPESVHQLRVATRRAMAVLQMFQDMLPAKRFHWFRKRLKRIRKSAGEARDLDVLAERLKTAASTDSSPACQALLERVQAARRNAQRPIVEIYATLKQQGFARRAKRIAKKTRWRDPCSEAPTFLAIAQKGMAPIASAFFAAGEADLDDTEALHQFRIVGKRLRYAMEVFAAAFAPAFRKEIYPVVEELQGMLGEINDHAAGRDRYLTWLDDTEEESQRLVLGKLIAVETAGLQESTRRFRQWWTIERAANLKSRFWSEIQPAEIRCA
jgi:CHAD domain-containing protein